MAGPNEQESSFMWLKRPRGISCPVGEGVPLPCPGKYPCPVWGRGTPQDLTGVPPSQLQAWLALTTKDQVPVTRGYPLLLRPPVVLRTRDMNTGVSNWTMRVQKVIHNLCGSWIFLFSSMVWVALLTLNDWQMKWIFGLSPLLALVLPTGMGVWGGEGGRPAREEGVRWGNVTTFLSGSPLEDRRALTFLAGSSWIME